MRTAFIDELCSIAAADERVWLVTGDLGFSVLEKFADLFPDRYLNAGVAEQNMTGIAAGLALSGKIVFTYSIANFPVARCLEQIRNDVCYHNLNVKVVAVGGGLAYGSHGYTHHAVEDLALMSALPLKAVVAPGDPIEARCATRLLVEHDGPAYLRIGKAGEPVLHAPGTELQFGKALVLSEGSDVSLISTGGMLANTMAAKSRLESSGVRVRTVSMPFVVPLDGEAIRDAAKLTRAIVTVEEHGPGGLGTAVAEFLATNGITTRFKAIRLGREPIKVAGTQEQLRTLQGLDAESIAKTCESIVASARGVTTA